MKHFDKLSLQIDEILIADRIADIRAAKRRAWIDGAKAFAARLFGRTR